MSAVIAARQTLTLVVPKTTGTQGDTLVAWGLAILAGEALGDARVILSNEGQNYRIESTVPYGQVEHRLEGFSWQRLGRARLRWLASKQKGRTPKDEVALDWVERDELREDYLRFREQNRAMSRPLDGDTPAETTKGDAQLYPFYEVLTNPGTQWAGYNSFVERLYGLLTPDGLGALFAQYEEHADDLTNETGNLAPGSTQTPKRGARLPTFNPPGFLYPGMNKGPTMRVVDAQGMTVGSATAADWTLIDRGDRSLFENYLAYIGYFQVARIVTTKEQRIVAVPIPSRVQLRVILGRLPKRELEATNLTDYVAAYSALEYGRAALRYLVDLQGADASSLERRGAALSGAHLSMYWRPNGNVFAPKRMTQVTLPTWLPALRDESLDVALESLAEHQKQLKSVRGRWRDEKKLSAEQREAIAAYLHALNGDLREWFYAVASWFPAARAAARIDWRVGLWSTEEVRRIALAMSKQQGQESLAQIVDAPEFKRLASTIRMSTVVPHINRERSRKTGGETLPWDIQYDLVRQLRGAAERGPEVFLGAFYTFIADYNDETARPKTGRGRALARTDDLSWLSAKMGDPQLAKVLPAALLAFGTSLRGKANPAGDIDTGGANADDTSEPDGGAEETE